MKITVKIRKLYHNAGLMLALVSVTLDDLLAVHDMKVIQGHNRLFVAMPSQRDSHGAFRDVVHPINAELREDIERAVLSAYQEALAAALPKG